MKKFLILAVACTLSFGCNNEKIASLEKENALLKEEKGFLVSQVMLTKELFSYSGPFNSYLDVEGDYMIALLWLDNPADKMRLGKVYLDYKRIEGQFFEFKDRFNRNKQKHSEWYQKSQATNKMFFENQNKDPFGVANAPAADANAPAADANEPAALAIDGKLYVDYP